MFSLTDSQLAAVFATARTLPTEQRDQFLRAVAARLRISDVDVDEAIKLALALLHVDSTAA